MSTIITKLAIIKVSAIILTRPGISFLRADIVTPDRVVVKITPKLIITVFSSLLVTASVEHIPNTWANTGLFFPIGSVKVFFIFPRAAMLLSPLLYCFLGLFGRFVGYFQDSLRCPGSTG